MLSAETLGQLVTLSFTSIKIKPETCSTHHERETRKQRANDREETPTGECQSHTSVWPRYYLYSVVQMNDKY